MQPQHHDIPTLLARIAQLEAMLAPKQNAPIERAFNLTAAPARLLSLLLQSDAVTKQSAEEQLGPTLDLRVTMCRLRAALSKHDIEIQSRRFSGYWLTDESKKKIEAILAGEPTTSAPAT